MKQYIGTKRINAGPMTRQAYNDFRGWKLPDDENGADEGYLVEYVNGGPANTSAYAGYVSWSPKEVFDQAYRATDALTFGEALEALKAGCKVARRGWNGKGMWIVMMPGMNLPPHSAQDTERKVNDRTAKFIGEDTPLETLPYIAMWTVNSKGRKAWLPGWLASQTDMLSDDWEVVEGSN